MSNTIFHSANSKSVCTRDSVTHSPLIFPDTDQCLACSLTCQIKFDYARVNGWQIAAARVIDDGVFRTLKHPKGKHSILRFYVNNHSASRKPHNDITFNNSHYQLEFIEFYLPSLHQMPVDHDGDDGGGGGDADSDSEDDTDSPARSYPVEMVMCHRAVNSGGTSTKWVNVSVFAIAQNSYSLTNTFFYQLINTALVSSRSSDSDTSSTQNKYIYNSSHLSESSDQYVPNITWMSPTVNGGPQYAIDRNNRTNGSPAINIDVGEQWTPYQALPAKKAFYSYLGEFVYSPCKFDSEQKVTWVVMEQPVAIHQSEFRILQAVIGRSDSYYTYNKGDLYHARSASHGRNIMYNNGELVIGNQDQDKFYIKCVKRSDVEKPQRAYESDFDEVQQLSRTVQSDEANANTKQLMHTVFDPPRTVMSSISFCVVLSVAVFAMFASANWFHARVGQEMQGRAAAAAGPVGHGVVVLCTMSLLLLYCLAFVLSSVVVGLQPFAVALLAVLLMFWTAYPMKFLIRHGAAFWSRGPRLDKIWGAGLYFLAFFVWVKLIIFGTAISFAPLPVLNGRVDSAYTYFFGNGTDDERVLYVCKAVVLAVDFAGYNFSYYNRDSAKFDSLCMALPSSFYSLFGYLTVQMDEDGNPPKTKAHHVLDPRHHLYPSETVTERHIVEHVVLVEYDRLMKADHTKPLDNLLTAIDTTLNNPKNFVQTDDESTGSAESSSSSSSSLAAGASATIGQVSGSATPAPQSETAAPPPVGSKLRQLDMLVNGKPATVLYKLKDLRDFKITLQTISKDLYTFLTTK